jgi:peptide/nickel transport system permease protein
VIAYVLRRLLWVVVLLLVISFITFLIFYTLPSADPALLRAGRNPPPEVVAAIRSNLGLDQPWYVQYAKYLERVVLHFDFGYSYQSNVSVRSEVLSRLPTTALLALGAAVLWLVVGVAVGIVSAVKRRSLYDRIAMGSALVAISAPVYWLGLVALYLVSKDIGVIPIFHGAGTFPRDLGGMAVFTHPTRVIPSLLLPWIVLATASAAVYARFMRASLLEVLSQDYVRTARAKGLPERTVILKHGARAAIMPIVTLLGLDLGLVLGGAILTETVFNIPGIGTLAFDAIQKSDLPMVQGTVLIGALFIIVMNLLVDIGYAYLDPRVRY